MRGSGGGASHRRRASRPTPPSLIPALQAAHAASRETYGRPRLTRELRAQGYPVGERRVGRLLRALNLVGGHRGAMRRQAWRRGGRARPGRVPLRTANVLARAFAVGVPDRAWVCDTTRLPTRGAGTLLLAVVLDLGTRRVLGWALGTRLTPALTWRALTHAFRQGRQPALHHSDQGGEYVAGSYGALLAARGIGTSWSRPYTCWDNAVMESFIATLKTEAVPPGGFDSLRHADLALFEYIEIFYNRQRRHSSLDYLAPVTYEAMLTR